MSAVCPKCGVAVVPGYVKCPKCQAALPKLRAATVAAGGTSSSGGGGLSPTTILIAVAVLGAGIAVFALRGGSDKAAPVEAPSTVATPEAPDRPVAEPDETPAPTAPPPVTNDPTIAVRDLDRALKKERLWGTVEVVGSGVDVRSAGCRDATMMPVVDAAIPALREAGVTKVRCLEQAGAVVFEREL